MSNVTLTEKHSESGKVARISRKEKSVRMNAQMPGPPGSAVIKENERNKITNVVAHRFYIIDTTDCHPEDLAPHVCHRLKRTWSNNCRKDCLCKGK